MPKTPPYLLRWTAGSFPMVCLLLLALACAGPSTSDDPAEPTTAEGAGQLATDAVAGAEAPPSGAAPPRSEGTRAMVERLDQLAASRGGNLLFRNILHLEMLREKGEPADPAARRQYRTELATELLRTGASREAAEILASLLAELDADTASGEREKALRSLLAIAHLRQGEQENCVELHGSGACLLPIPEEGRHTKTEGSEAALAELERLLRLDPDDLGSRWLYNIAAMTLGRYPDGVPEPWRIDPALFESADDIGRFPDVATRVGLDTLGLSGGASVDDFDGDGDLDVVASSWGFDDPLRYFENQSLDADGNVGQLRFVERTREAGLEGLDGGLNINHADYDNDGDLDILVLRGAWLRRLGRQPNSLLRNDGQGRFEDVTEEAGLLSFHPTQAAAWADFDNDGWLDLYIANESSPGEVHAGELFRNNGPDSEGRVSFTDVAFEAGVRGGGMMKGVVWGDFDNDGRPDLYISRLRAPNLLFRNLGPQGPAGGVPLFEEVAAKSGVEDPYGGFPAISFDFDQDGHLDLFAGAFADSFDLAFAEPVIADLLDIPIDRSPPELYRNRGDGTFENLTTELGLDRSMLIMAANYGDLDNDGWPELYLGTGAPDFRALVPNRMFRNDRGRRFLDITSSGGFGHLQKGHGIAFGDLDQDGDQDVFAVMGGAFSGDVYQNVLFLNPGHGNRFVILRLIGETANRGAIGARIRLDIETPSGPRQVHAEVGTGGSFGASGLQQEIGLGDATALRRIEVRWIGSEEQSWTDLPMDRILTLRQYQNEFEVGELRPSVLPPDTSADHAADHRH